jgi:hypothetical protein
MRKADAGVARNEARCLAAALGLAWACLVGPSAARAQAMASARELESTSTSRLLSASEGRFIVNAAWELNLPIRGAQDCSHVVHQIYANAGFDYPYASSFEIYAGHENFERVRLPQSGDVIAWPGHVGIVVDPLQHSFYSLVRSGFEAQDYQAPYWKSRGRPRFFRYKVENDGVLSADKTPAPPLAPPSNGTKQRGTTRVAGERTPAEIADPNRPPRAVSEKTKVNDRSATPPAAEEEAEPFELPTSIIVAQRNKPPTREEVAEGISEVSDAFGSVLRAQDPLKTQLPLVIVEQFKVERVDVKRDHGWARLEVESKVSIGGGSVHAKHQREKVRWELRRTDSGWEAVAPPDRNYVPHDVAVKNLAAQLAQLTVSDGAAAHQETVLRQESSLANLLSLLLESKATTKVSAATTHN